MFSKLKQQIQFVIQSLLLCFFIVVFFWVRSASAATETFSITQTISGVDVLAPSAPPNLALDPVTTSQINLSWDASNDNVAVTGYQIFRDGGQIATTTLLTYSDTGLSSGTVYGYNLTAFDAAGNISATSTVVSTSTIASTTPPASPSGGSGGGSVGIAETEIDNLAIEVTRDSAHITFDTNVYVSALFRWGRTQNYEEGYIASDIYRKHHETMILDLAPGTVYELEITVSRRASGEDVVEKIQFTTEAAPDTLIPQNVMDLEAEYKNGVVELEWTNPDIPDFSHVRVVGSSTFYPTDALDGWFVYEGPNQFATDTHSTESVRRYYAVFTYDESGNRSSGAVVFVDVFTGGIDAQTASTEDPVTTTLYDSVSFDDLVVIQDGATISVAEAVIAIDRDEDTTFSIPYNALPRHLKTVVVTLKNVKDPDRQFSFLLSINKARTAYEAVIGNLPLLGTYTTEIEIFDYNTQTVTRTRGEIVTVDMSPDTTVIERFKTITEVNWGLITGVVLAWVFLIFYFVRIRRRH